MYLESTDVYVPWKYRRLLAHFAFYRSFSLSCPSSVRPNVCGCNVLVQTARSPIGNMFSKDPCVWWSYMSVTKGGASTWGKRECPARHIWAWYQEFIGIRPAVLPIQFWGVFPRHDPRAIMAKVAMLRFKEKPSTNWWFPIDGFDYHGLPSGPSPPGPFMLNMLNPPTAEPWFLVWFWDLWSVHGGITMGPRRSTPRRLLILLLSLDGASDGLCLSSSIGKPRLARAPEPEAAGRMCPAFGPLPHAAHLKSPRAQHKDFMGLKLGNDKMPHESCCNVWWSGQPVSEQ